MPVYDERATVERAIEAVLETELPAPYELIVIDDGSRDGTCELLPSTCACCHTIATSATARRFARPLAEARGTFTTILDADLEYLPSDIPSLLEPLLRGGRAGGLRNAGVQIAFGVQLLVRRQQPRSDALRERHLQLLDLRPDDRT
jgi:cellulose synthase/poly-beta-1,6-N-acetylglucosamine synthase-like glycosyltransferase